MEQSSTALRGVRDRRSCLPKRQQKWGDVCPPLGWHRARGKHRACPFRPLAPKGGARFRGQGRQATGNPRGIEDAIRGSRLPARSALNGAHRAPAPPDEGSCVPVARAQNRPERKRRLLRKTVRRTIFLFSCVCRRRLRPWDAVPHPATFEKVDETFTRLRRGRALSVRSGAAFRRRPRARRDSPGTGLIDTPSYSNTDSSSPGTQRGFPGTRPALPGRTWPPPSQRPPESSPRAGCPPPPGP